MFGRFHDVYTYILLEKKILSSSKIYKKVVNIAFQNYIKQKITKGNP